MSNYFVETWNFGLWNLGGFFGVLDPVFLEFWIAFKLCFNLVALIWTFSKHDMCFCVFADQSAPPNVSDYWCKI